MTQGNVGRGQLPGPHQLEVAVGGETEAQAGSLDGGEIRRLHVFLPQVHPIGTRGYGLLPVIVDKEPGPEAATQGHRLGNGWCYLIGGQILDAQLQCLGPGFQQPLQPLHRIHHRIEAETLLGRGKGPLGQAGRADGIEIEAAIQR
ncbi:hypothetical protein D3C80_1419720 [compost metagenome]